MKDMLIKNKLIIVASFISFGYLDTVGQSITIKSVSLQPNDKTAIIQPCFDINQDTCALLKIKLTI